MNEAQLNEMLSRPSEALKTDLLSLHGDVMVIGAGGKMGPTLSVIAKRALGNSANVIAVSRFSDPEARKLLSDAGVEMLSCELTDPDEVARLPKCENIVFMAGRKFGTSQGACETWEMNTVVPSIVTRHFGNARYTVFSTSNVYPFSRPEDGGCTEDVTPAPVGEYASSCLGRERVFEYAAAHYGAKVLKFRLSYAIDLRYGILNDLCQWILSSKPVPLGVPAFNCVWQRYANEAALRSLLLADENCPALNVTGPETVSVKQAARKLAGLLGKEVAFAEETGDKGILCNSQKCMGAFGYPDVSLDEMMRMQAEWILDGGRCLGKPTHFEEQKGNF
jgi:nucleoside-diphosphate-sugar epimerase